MTDLERFAKDHWRSVIFCRECRHYKPIPHSRSMGCEINSFIGIPMKKDPDHYCADGERKNE